MKDKKDRQFRDHYYYTGEYRGAAHSICNLKYSVHVLMIMILSAEELKKTKQFSCLGENPEKYITFTVPKEKDDARIDKNGEEITKNIPCIFQFVNSARFMASSLLNLVNNFSEGVHRIKCKYEHNDKKFGTFGIKYEYCDCFLEYINFEED